MSITAGSFIDLYGPPDLQASPTYSVDPTVVELREANKESFDVVVTSFFLDTASNIIEYIKAISYCLKKDGIWINFGPLLWHFEGDHNVTMGEGNVPIIRKGLELSRDDLIELIENLGFVFEKRESGIESSYCRDIKSLGCKSKVTLKTHTSFCIYLI
ncbi:uncharacterized protein J8A68_005511 [[Candida] subhashii]|uniref:Carnosine N-methyltransferase n=1 Tax=[Candida] subhashii TaxID=561895 RepID=A0A8J5UJA7_9ASCO|nr:uncharacterized protein J8A68_005511 [[Candida] subhashii]KAG7660991.1 hypothetical protein J8A68_005511 [[Candida] subhashii]